MNMTRGAEGRFLVRGTHRSSIELLGPSLVSARQAPSALRKQGSRRLPITPL